jgi:hypothetical protein
MLRMAFPTRFPAASEAGVAQTPWLRLRLLRPRGLEPQTRERDLRLLALKSTTVYAQMNQMA